MEIIENIRETDDDGKQELVLTMLASAEDVDAAVKEFMDELQTRELKGFRKGKAPRNVLEQSVGGHANAMGTIAERMVNSVAIPLVDEAGIIFLDKPTFNSDSLPEDNTPYKFTVSGPVGPIMKLTDYGPVSIEMPPDEPTEVEIERQLEALQEYYHTFEDISDPEHEAELGDYLMGTITVTDSDGKVVGGLRAQSRMIGLGEGTMPMTFDERIVGSKAGQTLEFDFDAINADGTSEYGDGHLHAVVDVKGFRRMILPEIDDDLAHKVGCMDKDDLYKEMRRNIGIQKQQTLPKMKVDRVVEQVIKRLDGEVPQYYVDFIREDVGREFMQNLEKDGTNLQQFMLQNQTDGEKMKAHIDQEARHRATIDCALEAIFAEKGLTVTDEDIREMFSEGEEGEQTLEKWREVNRVADVMKMIRQQKATEWLVDTADVTIVE